jgi:hypothetical protein
MLYISLGVSAVFLVVVNLLARRRSKNAMSSALAFSLVVTGFSVFMIMGVTSPAVILACGAVSGLAYLCEKSSIQRRFFAMGSVAATLTAYIFVGLSLSLPDVRQWQKLEARYPLESMEDRLAYETRPPVLDRVEITSLDEEWLASLENGSLDPTHDILTRLHVLSLEHLHAGTVKQFVDSPGFGVARAAGLPTQGRLVDPREPEDTREKGAPELKGYQSTSLTWNDEDFPDPARTGNTPERETHRGNILVFLDPWYLGYVRDRQHVAGFRSHAFHKDPTEPKGWTLQRLELVGILKFAKPVVYQTQRFPSMEEAADVPTRPLDAFESESLTALLRGENLVARESSKQLRLFGSIRATNQCMSCHHGERGDLLGAFSYQLSR